MGQYSLICRDNQCVIHIAEGVRDIELNAVLLDHLIGSLTRMREQISPPPPPKVQPAKGAEMPINKNGCFEPPSMDDFLGGMITPSSERLATYLSLQYGNGHTPRPCEVVVPLHVAGKLTACLQTMLAEAHERGLS